MAAVQRSQSKPISSSTEYDEHPDKTQQQQNNNPSKNDSISTESSESSKFSSNKQLVTKGTEFLAVISRLYIYNVIKDFRSKMSTNNPNEKESLLFDFLLNVHYPIGTDIQELNCIIDSLDACCRYLVGRDPRFYNAPFKVNYLLSNNSLRINEGSSSNVFANLLDDNKILHSFIMAMHDINRKIKVVFSEYQNDYDDESEENKNNDDSSSPIIQTSSKRRASLIEFTKSLEKKRNMEKFEYLLLSKLCAVLQLLASCCMEMYRANRIHLIKALVLAFNRVMIEENRFVSWFAKDGLVVLKRLQQSNNGRIRTRTERAMNKIFPESVLLKLLKYLSNADKKVKEDIFEGILKNVGKFLDDNWRALVVTIVSMGILTVLMDLAVGLK